jgi:alkylation response protein AidB-like acyl-CoA dehydrogenase
MATSPDLGDWRETIRALADSSARDVVANAYHAGGEPPANSWSTSVLGPAAALAALDRHDHAAAVRAGRERASLAGDRSSQPALAARREGDQWLVDGRVSLVVGASTATTIVVSAVDAATGAVVVGVAAVDDEGLDVRPVRALGDDDVADVELRGVHLNGVRLGHGSSPITTVGWLVTLAAAAELAGVAAAALGHAVTYVQGREQFGRPIGTFQSVQHRLADALVDVVAASDAVADAAERIDAGRDAREVIVGAKLLASTGARRVVAIAQQVHGGVGYYEDAPLPRLTQRAIALSRRSGDPDSLREHLVALAR